MKIKNSSNHPRLNSDRDEINKFWEELTEVSEAPNSDSNKSPEDVAWLDSDLSNLSDDSYDWKESKLDNVKPVRYIPGKGLVIE